MTTTDGMQRFGPPVSIITPTLNGAPWIADCVTSVATQGVPVQHLFIDGGSTDETVKMIRQCAPEARVLVAPGTGIYSAINKGLEASTAEFVCLLNCDDCLFPGALSAMLDFAADSSADVFSGDAEVFLPDPNGEERRFLVRDTATRRRHLDLGQVLIGVPIINARIFRRSVFSRVGSFSTSYRLAGDREFLARLAIERVSAEYVGYPVYRYRRHGQSATLDLSMRNELEILDEHEQLGARLSELSPEGPAARATVAAFRLFTRLQKARAVARRGHRLEAGVGVLNAVLAHPRGAASLPRHLFMRRFRASQTGPGS